MMIAARCIHQNATGPQKVSRFIVRLASQPIGDVARGGVTNKRAVSSAFCGLQHEERLHRLLRCCSASAPARAATYYPIRTVTRCRRPMIRDSFWSRNGDFPTTAGAVTTLAYSQQPGREWSGAGRRSPRQLRTGLHLIHDRDNVYGKDFDTRLAALGVIGIRTPYRAPKANAIAESLAGTLRRECLDHIILLNEGHLVRVLREFAAYYNRDRPHRSLELSPPLRSPSPPLVSQGAIVSKPVLGGLHHVYSRAA